MHFKLLYKRKSGFLFYRNDLHGFLFYRNTFFGITSPGSCSIETPCMYLIQIDSAQNASRMCMCVAFPVQVLKEWHVP